MPLLQPPHRLLDLGGVAHAAARLEFTSAPTVCRLITHHARLLLCRGRLAGSAMSLQPWRFIVIQEAGTLRRLGALARSGPYIAQAPLAIVVADQKPRHDVRVLGGVLVADGEEHRARGR
jgi:nitroreductase